MSREDEIIKERMRKLLELRKQKINPYPYSFEKKNNISECLKMKLGAKVKTAGRLMTKRDLGKIAFCDLTDSSGKMQIVFQDKETPKKEFEFFKKYVDSGDFVGIEGKTFKTKTKQVSILVKKIEMLSKSVLPLPEKWHGLQDKEERYRKRYLDLIMNPEARDVFAKREKIIDAVRDFFKKKGFMEVDTPALQPLYGGAEAKPFKTHLNALDVDLYMSISPELYLKRIIVGGFEKVFTIARNFRNEGIDKWHNPEFTMLEAYQAYSDYNEMMKIFEELYESVCKKINGTTKVKINEQEIDFKAPWKRMKMSDAIKKFAGIDVEKKSAEDLKKIIEKEKIKTKGNSWGYYVAAIFEHFCESKIAQPTFIIDHPFETTPLCKLHRNDKECRLIERFEPFCVGVELGNAYSELNDPIKQKELLEEQQKRLAKGDEEANPLDTDFIEAMEHGMPPTGGLGVGIDRMIILLTGQNSIRDVIFFPFMKPEGKE
ncbi:lysine--tRNA ligase [Candidatus Pacearchaeota archaeon]|nr:lysine--tRNA ligase [Candidatus Pacearchaeota archaeon]